MNAGGAIGRNSAEPCEADAQEGLLLAGSCLRQLQAVGQLSLGSVAASVAEQVRAMLDVKRFPEDFVGAGSPSGLIDLTGENVLTVDAHPMMGSLEVALESADGRRLHSESVARPIAELLIRAIMLGRQHFELTTNELDAQAALPAAITWLRAVGNRLDRLVRESTAGSGYEDQVRNQVHKVLGIHPSVFEEAVPTRFTMVF